MSIRSALTATLLLSGTAGPVVAGSCAPVEEIGEAFRRVSGAVAVIRTVEQEAPPLPGGQPTSVAGVGSGVLISRDGKVVTAAHVVQTASEIEVEFTADRKWKATVVASDPSADVALLQLEHAPTDDIPVATLGDSGQVQIGDQVFVVGAPLGVTHTLTVGYVSARRQKDLVYQGAQAEFLQTDAAINPGNSGGPMFNMDGQVVGIVSHIISQSGGSEGLGFAVTSNLARQLLLDRDAFWSGLTGVYLSIKLAQVLNVPSGGMLVQKVVKDSPAHRLGIRGGDVHATLAGEPLMLGGDVIVEVAGVPFNTATARDKIRRTIASLGAEDLFVVRVLRGGVPKELSLTRKTALGEG